MNGVVAGEDPSMPSGPALAGLSLSGNCLDSTARSAWVLVNRVTGNLEHWEQLTDWLTYQEPMVRVTISLPIQEEAVA